jgi:hypothetical protein
MMTHNKIITLWVLAALALATTVASADDHDHDDHDDHDHDHDDASRLECGCALKALDLTVTCDKVQVQAAYDALVSNNCAADCASGDCSKNYLIVQSAHDYCHHEDLPVAVEKGFHTWETACAKHDCLVKRKFDVSLPTCATTDCGNTTAATAAITTLRDLGCAAGNCTTSAACATAYRLVRAVHDSCAADQISSEVELAVHDYESPCEAAGCNSADESYDPNTCTETSSSSAATHAVSLAVIAVACLALVL